MIPDIEAIAAAADRLAKSVPAEVVRGEKAVGLYGVGLLGRWALPKLQERGIKIKACYDANEKLKGTIANGVPVHAADELKSIRPPFVFTAARHAVKPVSRMLTDLNIPHVSYDAWHAASDFSAFRRVHDSLLQDAHSRNALRAVLMAMLTGDTAYCAKVSEGDQYFCLPQFRDLPGEIYVDAGAYVGDSIERFIWAHNGIFRKIHAFEPGARQFAALKARMRRLSEEWALDLDSVALSNAGLGERASSLSAGSSSGQPTSLALRPDVAAGTSANVVTLDEYLNGSPITFLKADVEGMEVALLRGARETIRRQRPKIAICVYHYPADIPDIADYLSELVPAYRFALRQHSPQLLETVLYCWT